MHGPLIVTLHIIAVIVAPTGQLATLSGNFFQPRPPIPAKRLHPAAGSPADRELSAKVAVERTSNLSMGLLNRIGIIVTTRQPDWTLVENIILNISR
jgi:hypothetical protein